MSKAIPHYSADDNVLASGGLNTAPLLESVRPGTAFSNTLRLSMKAGLDVSITRADWSRMSRANRLPMPFAGYYTRQFGAVLMHMSIPDHFLVGRSEAARSLDGRPEAKTK